TSSKRDCSSDVCSSDLAASTSTNNSTAQTAALLAFLQQIQKVNPTQSLLMAQQLGLLSGAAASSSNNPMAQLLNFPNLLYSSLRSEVRRVGKDPKTE